MSVCVVFVDIAARSIIFTAFAGKCVIFTAFAAKCVITFPSNTASNMRRVSTGIAKRCCAFDHSELSISYLSLQCCEIFPDIAERCVIFFTGIANTCCAFPRQLLWDASWFSLHCCEIRHISPTLPYDVIFLFSSFPALL